MQMIEKEIAKFENPLNAYDTITIDRGEADGMRFIGCLPAAVLEFK